MNVQDLKKLIGDEVFEKLDREADAEIALALKAKIQYPDGKEKPYNKRFLLPSLLSECQLFQEKKLKFSPLDVVNNLFKCKILFAVKDENEYRLRSGHRLYDETTISIPWEEKTKGINVLMDEWIDKLKDCPERILVSGISSFQSYESHPQDFFDKLFESLNFPFEGYIEDEIIMKKYKLFEPNLAGDYNLEDAKRFLSSPSIGFKVSGTLTYCELYGSAWIGTLFALLKIAGFINPGQINISDSDIEITAPKSPVFLGTYTYGGACWKEDEKEPWLKVPDGSLWRSYGYRGISTIWLDNRSFQGIDDFFKQNIKIFEVLKNPWGKKHLEDIAPTLDILSSATQISDLGAKVLLIYCCLEHLFVPKETVNNNKKYIIGAINALDSSLLEWFERLYKLRCDYAHKGYIKKDDKVFGLVIESIRNVVKLLRVKLEANG